MSDPDSIIRKDIKEHFQRQKQLKSTISLYEEIIRQNPNMKEDLAWQIFEKKYENITLLTKDKIFVDVAARISIWKEEYNKEKNYMNSMMEKIENGTLSYTRVQDSKFKKLMQNQYHTLRKIVPPSDEYTYDKYVERKILKRHYFTYIEEYLLLESLRLWKKYQKRLPCTCRVCALIHLNKLAYALAKDTNRTQILNVWKGRKVEIAWLYEFEIRHKEYIHENFPSEEQCKNDPKVARQIPDVQSGKKSEDAKNEPSTSKSQPSSTSTKAKPSLPIQPSASFKIPSSSEPRFPIRVPASYVNNKNIWRERIKMFVQFAKTAISAAKQVVDKNRNERDVADDYKITDDLYAYTLFEKTVKIWKDRTNYYNIKNKINKDFQDVSSGDITLFTIAKKYDIKNYLNLFKQYKKYEETGQSNFTYDRYTFYGTLKYDQLRSIKEKFFKWSENENNEKDFCNCRTCTLEHLLDEVNASNIKFNLLYVLDFYKTFSIKPVYYEFKEWFLEINIMFSRYPEIFPIKTCKKDQPQPPQPSSSRTGFTDSSNLYVAPTSATQSSSQSSSYEKFLDSLLDWEKELNYSQASSEDQPSSSTSVSQPSSSREETLEPSPKKPRLG